MLEHLIASTHATVNKGENGKDVTISEQYRESIKAYQNGSRKIDQHVILYYIACIMI